ncbi:mechanosensitive ion channel family protein [Modicisalibacter sp. 'Wilcox']|uniref:mechanosensitive ion channel family protein n=1 Tax=Modicisalibacter sp. 'Wilcox' TaxID=2679914 RepID=UPI0013D2A737|nr:mechanosensitive ion channel family protein [Modicisalibacter sp. 'Wilcox']
MLEVLAPLEQWVSRHVSLPAALVTPLVILATALLVDGFTRLVIWRAARWLSRTRSRWDDVALWAIRRPLWVGIWGVALIALAGLIGQRLSLTWVATRAPTALWLFTLVMLGWFGIRLTREVERRLVFPPPRHPARPLDASMASAISKLVGALILTLVVLAALQALGMSPSGLLAFGGVGGLVVGFAARNVLANFFGGLAIHLDNPFKVGDWIRSPDRDIEGVVEDIGWRLTRIRGFDTRPLYVPNMMFGAMVVVNPSRMHNRRIKERIGLRYADLDRVASVTRRIRDYLEQHDDIEADDLCMAYFQHFGDSTLEILIHAYTRTTDWATHQAIQQEVLLHCADLAAEAGAVVAIPARELHVAERRTDAPESVAETTASRPHDEPSSSSPSSRRGTPSPRDSHDRDTDQDSDV